MFTALGWGWGCTLLALVALLAVPAPVVASPSPSFLMLSITDKLDVHLGKEVEGKIPVSRLIGSSSEV
jgi:hypothetical protein